MAEIRNEKAEKIIYELRRKYSGDRDAQEEIDRAVESILYYEQRGEDEKALTHAVVLSDFLHDWY